MPEGFILWYHPNVHYTRVNRPSAAVKMREPLALPNNRVLAKVARRKADTLGHLPYFGNGGNRRGERVGGNVSQAPR